RGPQTINELLTRSERIHRFDDADDVAWTLERLAQKQPAMTVRLPRRSGQREDRYMHLLSRPVDLEEPAPRESAAPASPAASGDRVLASRLERLDRRVADLEARLVDD